MSTKFDVIALPLSRLDLRQWRVPPATLLLGVYGLFGYHFLLFMALRHAPPVQANLINYLWPLGMVVMAPLLLPGLGLTGRHLLAALLGFAGAAWVILGAPNASAAGTSRGRLPRNRAGRGAARPCACGPVTNPKIVN